MKFVTELGAWNIITVDTLDWLEIFFYDRKVTRAWYIVSNNGDSTRTRTDEFWIYQWFDILQQGVDLEYIGASIAHNVFSKVIGYWDNGLFSRRFFSSVLDFLGLLTGCAKAALCILRTFLFGRVGKASLILRAFVTYDIAWAYNTCVTNFIWPYLHQFSRSQWLRKALEKTFRSVPVTSRGNQ